MSTTIDLTDLLQNVRSIFKVYVAFVEQEFPFNNRYTRDTNKILCENSASSKCKVLDESFPAKFFEKDPSKIFESYRKFIKSRSNADGFIKNEDKLALTTISERFDSGDYSGDLGGFYKLFHDVRLVCTLLIHYYPQGTRNYQMVDKFYKFATELLLRECYKIGASLIENDQEETVGSDGDDNELSNVIAADFIKISTNYQVPLSETYHIKTKDQDLFSSTIARSTLDERPHELPNSNFEINKVIPQTDMCEEAPRLGFVAANTSNIPDPTLPPTEMMTRFLHPNWYALPTTMWLKYGEYKSWAPSFNENGTVMNSTTRGIIWLERIGYMEMCQKSQLSKADESQSENKKILEDKEDQDVKLEGNNGKGSELESKEPLVNGNEMAVNNKQVITDSDAPRDEEPGTLSIKLENLLEWSPGSYIYDDEIECLKRGTADKLVTETLLQIKKLRKQRISNKVKKPSAEETKLYFKVRRILKEVILAKQTPKLPMNHCRSFPVLQANYNGGIPVIRVQPSRKRKSKR